MKLWRIDADYVNADGDVVGMLTWFSSDGHGRYTTDAMPGWNIDRYEQDAIGLTREQIGRLLGRTWPTLPIADLLAIVDGQAHGSGPVEDDDPVELANDEPVMADAKRQLQSAIERRQAWEKE